MPASKSVIFLEYALVVARTVVVLLGTPVASLQASSVAYLQQMAHIGSMWYSGSHASQLLNHWQDLLHHARRLDVQLLVCCEIHVQVMEKEGQCRLSKGWVKVILVVDTANGCWS